MTRYYHERTRLMGTKSMLHKASDVVNQWLLKLMLLVGHGSAVAGSRVCGVLLSCLVAALGALTLWRVPERLPTAGPTGPRFSIWQGWKETVKRRWGKKEAFLLCTATIVLAGVSKWFCYVPGAGWLLVIPSLLLAPGLVAVMVLVPSMTADLCDLDEVATGDNRLCRRRGVSHRRLPRDRSRCRRRPPHGRSPTRPWQRRGWGVGLPSRVAVHGG